MNPQRYRPAENIRPEGSYTQQYSNNFHNQNAGNSNHIISATYPQNRQRPSSHEKRPNHVSETSNSVTTFGTDGTMYRQTTSSVLHDGEEVSRKTSAVLRQDRLKELESNGTKSELKVSKRPFELKIFLTKFDPETT